MNEFKTVKNGFDFNKELKEARKRPAYHEEEMLLSIATRILGALEEQKITRVELARKLGVSPPYITKILRGYENMSIATLAKVAFALDLKWECILIPQQTDIGVFSLSDENGGRQIRRVETATTTCYNEAEEGASEENHYGDFEEFQYEQSVSA